MAVEPFILSFTVFYGNRRQKCEYVFVSFVKLDWQESYWTFFVLNFKLAVLLAFCQHVPILLYVKGCVRFSIPV
jgi:hypothetical protein